MNDNEMKDTPVAEEIHDAPEVAVEKRSTPLINKILIGLIILVVCLLIFQVYQMNNPKDLGNTLLEGETPATSQPTEKIELSTELFASDSLMLDFSDVTLEIATADIRKYYDQLTSDMSNFKQTHDVTLLPSDNIFELRFKETSTSIYFYDRVEGDQSYCSVVYKGTIVGNYLIPAVYYGNLFNVVYGADELTAHTQSIIQEQLSQMMESPTDIAVQLDADYKVTSNVEKISVFEGKIKGREAATIMYQLETDEFLIINYKNFKYYAFLTDASGNVLQQENYNHYELINNNYLYCYNDTISETTENFVMTPDNLGLKVVIA